MPSKAIESHPVGAALVVGGGIGGMQAALDLASSGIKVYLTDNKPAIGGVMSQLDKTFPTNDCAMCTMAPRLVEIGRHKDIEILTLSEVERVQGQPGDFTVTLTRQPRFVDEDKCTGCGACTTACPVTLPSEFDLGLGERKAIYRPYPQAVPNVFTISKRGIPPCEAACPLHQAAQGYVTLIAQGRFEEALQVILRDNPIPAVCGRICTHPCNVGCTRGSVGDPVNMPALKRFVVDLFPDYKLPQPTAPERAEKIAIVGSGPAGLLCAYHLRQRGFQPTIFEALSVGGGMLSVGIPSFRLPRRVLNADLDRLRAIGIEIKLNTPVGPSLTLEQLQKSFSAVFIAIGAHVERKLGVPGENLKGVMGGVEFLRRVNLEGRISLGRRILVVGGGNSALDAARTALRCGAQEVTIVYRRTRAEMPADHREIEEAEREGIKLLFLAAPKSFQSDDGGRVVGLECLKMRLGAPDASGRPAPEPIAHSQFVLPCDAVVVTIGQAPEAAFLKEPQTVATTKWGTLKADPLTLETELPGVFAGGDCVSGPDVVVNAMLAGKKAALSIDRWLNGQDLRGGRELEGPYRTKYSVDTAGVLMQTQIPMQALDPATRGKTFAEVHATYTPEEAIAEAKRCLGCGICCDCHLCAACEAKAINYEQKAETRELKAGAIILAPGYEIFDAHLKKELGYGRFPNVVTALEFERILSASGPYSGRVLRPYDQQAPNRIAFIQCVGSRDYERDYCSSVCCMYATKEAIIAKEHAGHDLQCDIFFMDMRAFSKGFEQYYRRGQELGVRYIRCRVPVVEEIPETKNLVIRYLAENESKVSQEYDLVVLSVGMQPPKEVKAIAERFGVALNPFNFCGTSTFRPADSSREGIYVAGPFAEPKDIPETVMQASAAAAQVLYLLKDARGKLITPKSYPAEREVRGEEPRIGVFVCHCGTNIAGVVDVPAVVEYAKMLPHVVYTENNLYTCSNDTQDRIKEKIAEHKLNRVVVASCTPRTHEPLFRNTLREAGLNPYLFEMANIRDQCSWVHMHEPERATEKSKDLVRMAVAKARLLEPLPRRSIKIRKSALVIGGGLAGMTAALELASQGFETCLVEKAEELGGNLKHIHYLLNGENPQAELQRLKGLTRLHDKVTLFTGATIESIEGTIGDFKTRISAHGKTTEVTHGVVIVATGAREYKPTEYLYGSDKRVLTQRELEERLASGNGFLQAGEKRPAKTVVMIQCVGSRDNERPYCSRVCCAEAVKNALKIKALSPQTNVYVLYRDIRTYGFRESYYTKARQQGVVFVRYEEHRKPEVSPNGQGLEVSVFDETLSMRVKISADLVVLSAGIHPHQDSREIAQFLKVPLNGEGFFLEAHMKLRPVDFMTDGVFLCGLAHSPKTIEESILQAQAAAARAATILSQDSLELGANISQVIDEKCDGCAYCVDTCPYKAITLFEYMWQGSVKKVVEANEAICKGCGCCQATCPKCGILVKGFTLDQIKAQIQAALGAAS